MISGAQLGIYIEVLPATSEGSGASLSSAAVPYRGGARKTVSPPTTVKRTFVSAIRFAGILSKF